MLPPKRRATHVVGRYRIFDVLRHDLDGAPGGLADAYALEVRDWVAVVPVTPQGELVLVRQYRHGIDGFTVEVPGGMLDEGESPAEAAARELREETGFVSPRPLELLGSAHPNPPLQGNRYSMFLALDVERLGAPAFDVGEECEVLLRPLDEVRRTLGEGEMTHALVNYAIVRAFDALAARR